jgi:hypothetical protein
MAKEEKKEIKSAFDLAMERMAQRGEGLVKLSDEQKKRLAAVSAKTQAKIAEIEILHAKSLAEAQASGDADKIAKLQEETRRAIQKLKDAGEAEREKIKAGG